MITALSYEKRGGFLDHENKPRKSFTLVDVTETAYRKLVAKNRFMCEGHEFVEGVTGAWPEQLVRQHARNAGVGGDGDMDEVRARLLVRVMDNSKDYINAREEAEAVREVVGKVKAALEGYQTRRVSDPLPDEAPKVPSAEEESEPIVPPEAQTDEAWAALKDAWEQEDYRALGSALAALSEAPVPSKMVDRAALAEKMLQDKGLVE